MREYKLYKLKLFKTEKGLLGIQDYLNNKALAERYYDEEVDTGRQTRTGEPVYSGKIFFAIEKEEDFPKAFQEEQPANFNVRYFYDVLIEEDDNAKKSIKSCELVVETTDIIQGTMSPVRRTKPKEGTNETKPYVFFSYSIPTTTLNSVSNKQDFIDFMETRGMKLQENTYQDKYQFSGYYSLFENQIPVFSPLAYKNQHYLISIQKKQDKYYINNINPTPVFKEGSILLEAEIISIEDNIVMLKKEATYEELKENKATLLPYMAINTISIEKDGKYYKEMTFKVEMKQIENKVGDIIVVELNEKTFRKIQNPKITVDGVFEKETQSKLSEEEPEQKEEIEKQENNNEDFDGTKIPEIEFNEDDIPF